VLYVSLLETPAAAATNLPALLLMLPLLLLLLLLLTNHNFVLLLLLHIAHGHTSLPSSKPLRAGPSSFLAVIIS
jgi:hypothetical protein